MHKKSSHHKIGDRIDNDFEGLIKEAEDILGLQNLPIKEQRANIAVLLGSEGMSLKEFAMLHNLHKIKE